MAVFLAALDITIVSTALPTISDHFQSTSEYTWIGSAFLLAAAVVAPSWGKFSDIWGRKAILLIVTATFFLGSALCRAAVSLEMLIFGRAVQGVGGGGLLSLVSIVVGDLFPQRYVELYLNHVMTILTFFLENVGNTTASWAWYGLWPSRWVH